MANVDEIATRFCRRAEKLRTIAQYVKDTDCRDAMLTWATEYDRIAERAIAARIAAQRAHGRTN